MALTTMQTFDHPAAWKATDFKSKDDFSFDLTAYQIDAMESEVEAYKNSDGSHANMNPRTFPLTAISEDVESWSREIRHGRGLLMLRGLPTDRMDLTDLKLLYLVAEQRYQVPLKGG